VTDRFYSPKVDDLASAFLKREMPRRVFITRLLQLGLTPAAAAAVLAACGGAAESPGATGGTSSTMTPPPKDITANFRILTGPWTEYELDVQNTIAEAFKATYPNVTFEWTLFDWPTSPASIQTSLVEKAHDMIYLGESDAMVFGAEPDNFMDIGPLVDDPAFAEDRADFVALDRLHTLTPFPIALPIAWFAESALYVNWDMVKAAGFDDTFLDDWETFRAACKAMTDPANGVYGINFGSHAFIEWYGRARCGGGTYLNEDRTAPAIYKPEVVQATQDFVDLLLTDKSAVPLKQYDYETQKDAFVAQKVGTIGIDGGAIRPIADKKPTFEWSAMPWPKGPLHRYTILNTGSYAIAKSTPNPALAWEVLKHWTNAEMLATHTGVSTCFPSRKSAYELPTYTEAVPQQTLDSIPLMEQYGVWMESFPQFFEINDRANPQIERAYTGEISADEAVKNVESIVNEVMEF
jgi:ABC-type glycerol-3-phosphate transport system substrate-binding protein